MVISKNVPVIQNIAQSNKTFKFSSTDNEESFLVTVNITPILSLSAPNICNSGTSLVSATIANSNLYDFSCCKDRDF